ncbi:Mfa1 family fimbria major subunit [Porphyromonas levii]|uniref:Mfa1 family fimbria major subunit n=1 Tax=Porphyromonas levii TaxID=28114 RepID=UPI001BAE0C5E|nr:Mfa1 family fimbria major subunit [Porphyromonas levii]
MKKFLTIGAIFALALGLASCDKGKNEPENVNGGTGEKGWTSFTISLPTASGLRAEAGDVAGAKRGDTYGGTVGEQIVNGVRIVLYKDDIVKHVFTPGITTDGKAEFTGKVSTVNPATKSRFTTQAFQIEKAVYEVFVFLNPTQFVNNNTDVGMHKNALMNNSAVYEEAKLTSNEGFFMSNAKGGVLTDVNVNFKPTAAEAEAKDVAVKVPVERAVAKVFVNKTVPVDGVANGAKAEVKQFALDVINKKYFAVRHMGLDNEGKPEPTGTSAGERLVSYAVDPNMAGNPIPFATAKPADLTDEFLYISTGKTFADIATSHTVKPAGFDSDDNGIYVAENTMDAAEQFEVATTRVVFEVVYTPAGIDPGNSFVEYKGMTFKPEDFQAKINEWLATNTKTDADLGMPGGFTKEVEGLGSNTTLNFTEKSFVNGNIKFYLDGVSYYTTTIRHFDDELEAVKMGYGRYGVVRNNIYKLSITKISAPGEPVITEPDPEIPDDPDKNYIAVDVTVLPWLVRTQDVEL